MKIKSKMVWAWGASVTVLVLLVMWAWPLFVNSRKPPKTRFKIARVYAFTPNVQDAFDISSISYRQIVTEGPCDAGGVVKEMPIDLQKYISQLKGDGQETVTLVWLYKMKPLEVTRRNDLFGEDDLTITGTPTKEAKVYFAVVPKSLVALPIQWVYAETKQAQEQPILLKG